MVTRGPETGDVWAWLADVADPEIPVISIVDLGIVRDVAWSEDARGPFLRVTLTPTYSGCPAIAAIERDVVAALTARGIERVVLETQLFPAWTTDWLSENGRANLSTYGISPPRRNHRNAPSIDLIGMTFEEEASCPRCTSRAVELISRYGSTPCKALYRCTACREPFDHFKSH